MEFIRWDIFEIILISIISLVIIFLSFKIILSVYRFNKKANILNYIFDIKKFRLKIIFYLLSFSFLIFAYFWPIFVWQSEKESSSNIVFVIDISKSMDAVDVNIWKYKLSRLDAAKKIIADYIIKNPNNSYSIIWFADIAMLFSPLTSDSNVFLTYLWNLSTQSTLKSWTNLKSVFDFINWASTKNENLNYVLLSDWEDLWKNIDINREFSYISDDKRFFAIWLGSVKWAFIPEWVNLFWETMYKIFDWQRVVSKLDREFLKEIASKWKWRYADWTSIDALNTFNWYFLQTDSKKVESERKSKDIGLLFVALSLFFLIPAYFLNYKR